VGYYKKTGNSNFINKTIKLNQFRDPLKEYNKKYYVCINYFRDISNNSDSKMNNLLKETDPEIYDLIQKEEDRQLNSIELIASENYTSSAVMECLGSVLTNKYSEGRPFRRYYGGNQIIDQIESLCQKRALEAYRLSPDEWDVNVQPYSGSPANFAVYTAFLQPHDRIMGLDLPSGGHLTHGFYTYKKKVSATSIYFESFPYHIDEEGLINYNELEKQALLFKPKMIICGASAYPRDFDYARFREIANKVGAYLMCDMAHYSGFIATQEMNSPFEYCDVVTTTTHKTLRGPRSGLIFTRMKDDLPDKVHDAVFPGLQGGPHEHQIAGVAHQLKMVQQPEFKQYIQQVRKNAQALSKYLMDRDFQVSTNGTVNHIVLVNLRNKGITGSKMEKLCEYVNISLNKNAIYGDKNPMNPSGIRIGTSAMTTRGMKENDFEKIADYLEDLVEIGLQIQEEYGKKLVDFNKGLNGNTDLERIKLSVSDFADNFEYYVKN